MHIKITSITSNYNFIIYFNETNHSSCFVSSTGRVAQGVKLINLKDEQKVSTVATIAKDEVEETEEELGNIENSGTLNEE